MRANLLSVCIRILSVANILLFYIRGQSGSRDAAAGFVGEIHYG